MRHALEHVFEVGVGLDPVELCRGEKRGDDGPSICAAVRPGKQMVFSSQSHRPDGAFHRIGVEFDAAIIQEPAERRPARERIADGLGQPAARRNPVPFGFRRPPSRRTIQFYLVPSRASSRNRPRVLSSELFSLSAAPFAAWSKVAAACLTAVG